MKKRLCCINFRNFICKYTLSIAIVIGLILSLIISSNTFIAKCDDIEGKVFRLHILANSDSIEDQQLKLKVRDKIVSEYGNLFSPSCNLDEVLNVSYRNIDKICKTAQDVVRENEYNYDVNAQIVNMYFSTRNYEDLTLPAGNYNALRITIGEGKGKNWWCVLFPSICLTASQKEEREEKMSDVLDDEEMGIVEGYDKYELRFKFLEWLKGE